MFDIARFISNIANKSVVNLTILPEVLKQLLLVLLDWTMKRLQYKTLSDKVDQWERDRELIGIEVYAELQSTRNE